MNKTVYMTVLPLFIEHYIEAIRFTECGTGDECEGLFEFSLEALTTITTDCTNFMRDAYPLMEAFKIDNVPHLAHDFWLTRNGHGAGFWDGDWPSALGEMLDHMSKQYPEQDVYASDGPVRTLEIEPTPS